MTTAGVKRPSPPSAHDVARLAGVSQAAVSRAFTPGASISDMTRVKVMKAATELGYQPNRLARSLITGRSGLIGVVIGSPRNPFFLEALDALSDQLAPLGLHLLVFTAKAGKQSDQLVEALLQFRVDSLLLMSASVSSQVAERCRDAGIPVIFFNRRARAVEGYPSVTGANYAGPGQIAEHMIEQGYRNFAYIGGNEDSTTSQEREAGFTGKLIEKGFPPPVKAYGNYDRLDTGEVTRRLLSRSPRPDAIFCVNDMTGLAVIDHARQVLGLEIGREVGVAGFDDIEGASWHSFDLTSYSQPTDRMIAKVIDIIQDPAKLENSTHVVVEGELRVRGSTRRTPA